MKLWSSKTEWRSKMKWASNRRLKFGLPFDAHFIKCWHLKSRTVSAFQETLFPQTTFQCPEWLH